MPNDTVVLCECGCGLSTLPAKCSDARRGLVKGQPTRFINGHHNYLRLPTVGWRAEDRGYLTPCHIWQGALSDGYGSLGRRGRSLRAHRKAWMDAHGAIPDGLFVLHRCDERACCNVDHLFLGTHQDNMDDMHAKGRANPISRAKLTPDEVREIRTGTLSAPAAAARYGVTRRTIRDIRVRRTWRDIADNEEPAPSQEPVQ